MQHAIKLKYVSLAALLLLILGFAVPAFAEEGEYRSTATSDAVHNDKASEPVIIDGEPVTVETTSSEDSEESDEEMSEESNTEGSTETTTDKEQKDYCAEDEKRIGQEVRCEMKDRHEERKEFRNEMRKQWKEFGKTTDRSELQNQLQELMRMLIALLQQQMVQSNSN